MTYQQVRDEGETTGTTTEARPADAPAGSPQAGSPQEGPAPAGAHGATAAAPTRSRGREIAVEVALFAVLVALYRGVSLVATGHVATAEAHAHQVWALERWLHLPSELVLQQQLLATPVLAQVANVYYATLHFGLTGVVLVWLYLVDRAVYRRARTALVLLTATGLALACAYPLAPPRLMADLGFTDVAAHYGQSMYAGLGGLGVNQYGAMPSLHVGWALLVTVAVVAAVRGTGGPRTAPAGRAPRPDRPAPRARRRVRAAAAWLSVAHPVVTLVVVVATANHYWLDGVVGAAMFVASWVCGPAVGAVTARWVLREHR